jgi:hypothetical protein
LLVISSDGDSSELLSQGEDTQGIRPPSYQVPYEIQVVIVGKPHASEQFLKLGATTVDVSDDDGTGHSANT